jgi:hypothetical protein
MQLMEHGHGKASWAIRAANFLNVLRNLPNLLHFIYRDIPFALYPQIQSLELSDFCIEDTY